MKLPECGDLTQEVKDSLAKFVCLSYMYCPNSIQIASIPDSWYLFCKFLPESSKLPSTMGALEEHIECVRVQSLVLCHSDVATTVRHTRTWLQSTYHH